MKTWFKLIAVTAAAAAIAMVVPATAQAAPYCGITWGSLDKGAGQLVADPVFDVRAGRHTCYDRLVVDVNGAAAGYTVRYVSTVRLPGTGEPIPLRGGAFLEVVVLAPAHDDTGPTYTPANPQELVNVNGWRTFRQLSFGGSFDGYTTVGLGVRARLPFRVFTLAGPGDGSRVVIDVAHRW